ncbi:hypothetical protein [Actinophytocola algeriensis]|uniref:Cytochrome C biogenesis protein transmembrane region n=1 Tax=Actinophytocola algeriensis TaxID=1768010 RepID=A0A7W7Q2K0_9PSEU|nr:hypothetical protein [Actinophytocola algeriensis]MBB4905797.1 hypothetical protein [Actinophytocola algeriensis]MBE1472518.1 xanthosine utilization system XapX-like protein [Actinophytocola algeriensis]
MTGLATEPKQSTRNGKAVAWSVVAGILLAILWSYEFVDSVIGDNVANTLLGHEAKSTPIVGTGAGLLFAFVSGFAGTFTACNIAMAASVGPMSQAGQGSRTDTLRALIRPLGAFTAGMVTVSAVYGFVGVLLGDSLPQLSTAMVGEMPVRLIQSSVVFGIVGLAFVYLGLAALGVVRDIFADRPTARVVVLGALVGAFLIGRPYPMFVKLFNWAAETGNPLYGAATFALQSLGNIVIVTVLFALLILGTRGRFLTWLAGSPRRMSMVSGTLLLALGVFTVVYWDLRVPSIFGFGWFPEMPYN